MLPTISRLFFLYAYDFLIIKVVLGKKLSKNAQEYQPAHAGLTPDRSANSMKSSHLLFFRKRKSFFIRIFFV